MEDPVINASEVLADMVVNVRVHGVTLLLWRVHLAERLFKLGAWVLGSKVSVELEFRDG